MVTLYTAPEGGLASKSFHSMLGWGSCCPLWQFTRMVLSIGWEMSSELLSHSQGIEWVVHTPDITTSIPNLVLALFSLPHTAQLYLCLLTGKMRPGGRKQASPERGGCWFAVGGLDRCPTCGGENCVMVPRIARPLKHVYCAGSLFILIHTPAKWTELLSPLHR